MKIAIDLDGVLADAVTPWLAWYNERYDDDLKYEDIKEFGIHKFAKGGEVIYEYFDVPGAFLHHQVIPGAREILEKLCQNHTVYIVTSFAGRPHQCAEKWQWVGENFPDFDRKRLIFCQDKAAIAADLMIDDGLHNLAAFTGRLKIVFDQPWNRQPGDYQCRMYGWGNRRRQFKT